MVRAARGWLGVRWRHQGRTRAGCDCAGLVICVARELGLADVEIADYGRHPDGVSLERACNAHMQRIAPGTQQPGDVLVMRFENHAHHMAIVSELGIIHAWAQARRVVEHALDAMWRGRIVAAYALPGID